MSSTRAKSEGGLSIPPFLYGTAWKENETRRLTALALQAGFRGIDTANQRRHYHEAAVGEAIEAALNSGDVRREELFVQTKFTFLNGQDHRLPYDPKAPIATQVEQSFASSLDHLKLSFVDSYVLHGPTTRDQFLALDWEAWQAMESIHERGGARYLGVSNVSLEQLRVLFEGARVKPAFVQNRCYAVHGWDRAVRAFCTANGIVYQGFSLLTANRGVLEHPRVGKTAARLGRTPAQVVFRFALDVGMVPLTGTTDAGHMKADLEVLDFQLAAEDVAAIESLLAKQ
ncbi:aldo/keto reductase family protein [Limnoglobus roseus]|uniref:Aldo/keto reductase n=1 Tax=Limnoglobus roseus TaxID=2598579 RepID=A0A5C1A6P0_9BACT|nr:aldo/keto reductase [Limnoglobus roseus]QEL14919.1 aldo/keto reductase [Limnoglobus roseus]